MKKRYKAKHYKPSTFSNSIFIRIIAVICIVILHSTYCVNGILSYFSSEVTLANQFSIARQYEVIFDANRGTGTGTGTMPNQTMYENKDAQLRENTFTNTGFNFAGWNTEPDGTGTNYADGQSVRDLAAANSSITLYAQWIEETAVAEMDGVKYDSIAAAVSAVSTNNVQKTIKLLRNVEITSVITIPQNKNIVFNFQNFTVKNASGSNINIIANNGTLEIISGTIQTNAGSGAINNNLTGTLKVSGGRIIATGTRQAIYNDGGTLEITGDAYLSATASDRATVQNNKPTSANAGTITISGGTIVSTGTTTRGAVENAATGTVNITGGTIISNNSKGVDNSGTLIIGVEDANVDITSPVIQGATYGVNSGSSATLEFYDGIVKGKTNAFNNENYITDWEDEYDIIDSTEVISGETYKTAYLVTARAKVNFDANGGTTQETLRYVEYNTAIGTLPTATREHYVLDGWFTLPTGGTQIDNTEIISGDITYYAHWTKTEAVVTFDANGGTASESTRTVNIGTVVGTLPTATKQYKTFEGWYTASTGGVEISSSTIINDDITYYAQWDAQTTTVTFNANQGTVSEQTRTVALGESIGTLPIPTRTDYGFAGWYTEASGGTIIDENEIITEATTYYAHWISDYVAEIGNIKYETLQAAVSAVPTDNTETTVRLLTDTMEAIDVIENQNIIFDLQNYTLSNDGTKTLESNGRQLAIENKGTIKIMNGTITASTTSSTINNEAGATLIITGGNIIQTGTGGSKNKQAIYNEGGTVEISGTAYISAKNSGTYNGANRGAIQNLSKGSSIGTLKITGGTIVSTTGPAVVNQSSSVLEIGVEDGSIDTTTPTIQGETYGVQNSATFNFYDGTIKGKTDSISGTVTNTETGSTRVDSTEVIDGDTYNITYYSL